MTGKRMKLKEKWKKLLRKPLLIEVRKVEVEIKIRYDEDKLE